MLEVARILALPASGATEQYLRRRSVGMLSHWQRGFGKSARLRFPTWFWRS
jgi:hypothetical protein